MLSTVKMLRRLLRKAFLVTKRVKVILVNSRRGQVRMDRQPSLIRIDEKVGPRQPAAAKNRKTSLLYRYNVPQAGELRAGGRKCSPRNAKAPKPASSLPLQGRT